MQEDKSEYVYEPFADTEEYQAVNQAIVRRWVEVMVENGTQKVDRLIDVATGVATMTKLFVRNLPKGWSPPSVVCVDQSQEALEQAEKRLQGVVPSVELVHAPIEELQLSENTADVAMWGNGIHYLDSEQQRRAVENIRRLLRPGGWFCFNSAFLEESRPPETLSFYRAQVAKAVRALRSLGIKRDKRTDPVAASTFQPQEHYEKLLQQAGFSVQEMKRIAARLYQTAWEHISGFSQYAAGALHGYRPDVAAKAMRDAVESSLEEYGLRDENGKLYIPRYWLEAIARIPAS